MAVTAWPIATAARLASILSALDRSARGYPIDGRQYNRPRHSRARHRLVDRRRWFRYHHRAAGGAPHALTGGAPGAVRRDRAALRLAGPRHRAARRARRPLHAGASRSLGSIPASRILVDACDALAAP